MLADFDMQHHHQHARTRPNVLATKQQKDTFEQGVGEVMSKWTALQLAVDQEWGGTNSLRKADELIDDVIQWFHRKKSANAPALAAVLQCCAMYNARPYVHLLSLKRWLSMHVPMSQIAGTQHADCQRAVACRAGHDVAELEELLDTIMQDDFNTEAQDGSTLQVRSIVAEPASHTLSSTL